MRPVRQSTVGVTPSFSRGALSRRLLAWYARAQRELPWRKNPSPYSVWVSEVMLQQTRVEVVADRYVEFLDRFPTLETLAKASVDDVLAAWSGLGYYRRARSLHAGVQAVLERHDGRFPRTAQDALRLPGVGPYTAGAVLSIAYNLPVPAVDGNVERVVSRLLSWAGDLRRAPQARRMREIVEDWIPGDASSFNQALMELGATVCTPRSPRCATCPLASLCGAFRAGDPERYPETKRRQKVVPVELHAAVLRRGPELLLERVEEGAFLKGMWLFPFSSDTAELLARLREGLGVSCRLESSLGTVRHAITFRRIQLEAHAVATEKSVNSRLRPSLRWARPEEFGREVAVSSLAFKVLGLLPPP